MDPLFVGIGKDLRAEGVTVEVVPGWKTRGRPGTFTPKGKMNHHTASNPAGGDTPALGIVTHGRSDLPGPLSNFLIGRSGKIVIVAAGRCNHAGTGGPFRFLGKDAGNRDAVSVEIENNGVGESYPAAQMRTIEKLNVIILKRLERGQWYAVGHKEYTSRKIDPSFDMAAFRQRVRKLLQTPRQVRRWVIRGGTNVGGKWEWKDISGVTTLPNLGSRLVANPKLRRRINNHAGKGKRVRLDPRMVDK